MSQINKLANRIIEQRKAKNWSQSELSAKVGVSYTQIGCYETKGSQPPAEVLKKIADALDSTVDYLINESTADKANASLNGIPPTNYTLLMQYKPVRDYC